MADAGTLVTINGVELCVGVFGDPRDPAILLISGANASMDWWEDEFCRRLADGGRFVLRYDHRDTGQSVSSPPGQPDYASEDLLADAIGVLDAYGLRAANLVGISMGGAMAQVLALEHPDRVTTLTVISTSPAGPGEPDLPDMAAETGTAYQAAWPRDWSDREAVLDGLTGLARVNASPNRAFEEHEIRALLTRVLDRTRNVEASMTNHAILSGGGGRWRERLGELEMPTLVIHGADDPLFPIEHGEALAREIPDARLVRLDRVGHELPRVAWDVVVPAILEHTR